MTLDELRKLSICCASNASITNLILLVPLVDLLLKNFEKNDGKFMS
jgi:hypothetical protein